MRKFHIGDKVRLKSNDKVGIITGYRTDGSLYKGVEREVNQYSVDLGNMYDNWLKEDQLVRNDDYLKVSNKFEKALADLMIDINLAHQNFHMARNFHTIKQSYSN